MKDNSNWCDIDEIVLYGFGRQGKLYYRYLRDEYNVKCIIDNGINQKNIDSLKIINSDEYFKNEFQPLDKILIAAAGANYLEIKDSLNSRGLVENVDYMQINRFFMEINWEKNKKICLGRVGIILTERCTLKCKYCTECMPYIDNPKNFSLESLKQQVDNIFTIVDEIAGINLVGGETLMFRELPDFIEYLCEKYYSKIGSVDIITNGTIIPSEHLIAVCKKFTKVSFRVSDYSNSIDYKNKVSEITSLLKNNQIECSVFQFEEWIDMGLVTEKIKMYDEAEDIHRHMLECNGQCQGFANNKFFYCLRAWANERAFGCELDNGNDYIDLTEIIKDGNREKFMNFYMGDMEKGYSPYCNLCRGYASASYVQVAEQYKDDERR